MDTTKRSFRFAIISLVLIIIAMALSIFESNASYEIKVSPDALYMVIGTLLSIIPPVSFVFALLSISTKKSTLGTILCILSGLGTLMVLLSLINSAYQA